MANYMDVINAAGGGGGAPMLQQAQQLPAGLNWATLGADSVFNDKKANVYHPKGLVAPQIEEELRRLGYSGSLVNAMQEEVPSINPEWDQFRGRGPTFANVQTANPELLNWLANNGLSIQSAATSPDREGGMFYSQLVGKDGTSLLQDQWEDKTHWTDRYLPNIALAGIAGMAGAGLLGLGQAGAGAAAGAAEAGAAGATGLGAAEAGAAGIGTLGAGGTSMIPIGASMSPGALGITALGPAVGTGAELAALSAALPSLGGSAGAGAALGSADKAAMFGGEGYGAGMTGAQTGAYDSVLGATGSKGLADIAGTAAGIPGASSIGNLLGNVASAVGGGGNLASIIGGALGAADSGKSNTATTQSQIDPRMQQYLYGSGYGDPNSLLGAAQAQFKANPSGINPTMQQGLDMSRAALSDPAYSQSFQQMRSVGNGLLGGQVAGNPFTTGQATMQAGGLGGLLGDQDRLKALMDRGRGLLG